MRGALGSRAGVAACAEVAGIAPERSKLGPVAMPSYGESSLPDWHSLFRH